jgi:hypothetical protein
MFGCASEMKIPETIAFILPCNLWCARRNRDGESSDKTLSIKHLRQKGPVVERRRGLHKPMGVSFFPFFPFFLFLLR